MDFHLKQWRDQHQHHVVEVEEEDGCSAVKSAAGGFLFDPTHLHPQQQQPSSDTCSALPLSLFSPEPSSTKTITTTATTLSAFPSHSDSISSSYSANNTRSFHKMATSGGSYFSMGQWQELELQTLIYRHMLTGSAVPPELLHLLFKKNLLNSPFPPPYYLSSHPHPLYHYPNFQPAMLQSGYWGRGSMDPEPGRCRRTDGKKWRCSRDVVSGHKYCERHIHRGRNRSRKPVEIPTPIATTIANSAGDGGGSGGNLKTTTTTTTTPFIGGGGGVQPLSSISGGASSSFFDHFHHNNQRPSESTLENNSIFGSHSEMTDDDKSGGRMLRHFFDDWPRTAQESEHGMSNVTSNTNHSISFAGNGNPSSDFSLKLSTGNGDGVDADEERDRPTMNWGMLWGTTNPVASMGGPLAEALRRSASSNTSSPTSVLHQLQRGSTSEETSYVST